jgi:ubiquinone/menaquinone biosynthesis C-methylase UbiE
VSDDPTQRFYGRWARLYDRLADVGTVARLRGAAVDALAPPRGGTAVDVGTGTGANLAYLRDAVGPGGRLVGLDLTSGMLRAAQRRLSRSRSSERPAEDEDGHGTVDDGVEVDLLRADAARPPLRDGAADAVLASFVSGMLRDPDAAVRRWADVVGPGGRLALLDFARSTGAGRPLNPAFRAFVRGTSPPGTRSSVDVSPAAILDQRVVAAHRALMDVCVDGSVSHETHALGFARVSAGTVAPRDE